MIILGIETATAQVGCAVGGAEGVLASFHAARGRRHAETLAPAIEFVCRQARVELAPDQRGRGRHRSRACSPACGSASPRPRRMAQALRVPMIGLPSLDLLAFPLRHTRRLIVAVIDARRGEVFYASTARCPAACSG